MIRQAYQHPKSIIYDLKRKAIKKPVSNIIPPSPYRKNKEDKLDKKDMIIGNNTTPTRAIEATLNRPRCDLYIKVPSSVNPYKPVAAAIATIYEQIKLANNTVQISPWCNNYINLVIKSEQHTYILKYLRNYFRNLRSRKDGVYYSKINIRFTDEFYDLNVNISSLAKAEWYGIYKCPLQVEKYMKIGWLINTLRVMNIPFSRAAIKDTIGGNIEIIIRWITVCLLRRGQVPKEERIHTLHVDVSIEIKILGTRGLLKLYDRYKKKHIQME